MPKRKKFRVGDIVLVTARQMDSQTPGAGSILGVRYITHIVGIHRPTKNKYGRLVRVRGTGPYKLYGFTDHWAPKEMETPAPEKQLQYKLLGNRKRRYDSV